MKKKLYTLSFLAKVINAKLYGDGECTITSINSLQDAGDNDISFLSNPTYRKYLKTTNAAAVIITKDLVAECKTNSLVVANPYLGYAKISKLFDKYLTVTPKIHKTAIVADSATIANNVFIGANSVIHPKASLKDGVFVGDGCSIGEKSELGINTQIRNNVTICDQVKIGDNCIIHPGAVIGGDGFGNAHDGKSWHKIEHLGGVVIGNNVEIGCNTCIDRGTIGNTIIEHGVRLDNLIQIAHNVVVGENTAIASLTGISGGTKIGKNCMIGGGSGFTGHINIADNSIINGMSMITKSIKTSGCYASGTGFMEVQSWRKNAVIFKQLYKIIKNIKSSLLTK